MKISSRLFIILYSLSFLAVSFFPFAAAAQSSLNACFSNASSAQQCASLGLISPQNAANAVRASLSATSPSPIFFALPSKEVVAIAGGVSALAYLSQSNMQSLQEEAKKSYSLPFLGGQQLGVSYIVTVRLGDYPNSYYPVSDVVSPPLPAPINGIINGGSYWFLNYANNNNYEVGRTSQYGQSPKIISIVRADGLPNTSSDTSPPLSVAVSAYPDSSIYAAAAAAAAVAAAKAASDLFASNSIQDRDVLDAAVAAAVAAAALVTANPSASQADKDKAVAAAAAANAAKAKETDREAAAVNPANPLSKLSRKFPFGIFQGSVSVATSVCPSLSILGISYQFCWILDIIRFLRWVAQIVFLIGVVREI